MTDTDLLQPDHGPLRAAAEAAELAMNIALGSVLRTFRYLAEPFGSGGAWLVTGRRGTEAGRWPRAGPTDQSARSSRPGQPSAWWAAMNSWSGSSGPQRQASWTAGQLRTTPVPASGPLLLTGLMPGPGDLIRQDAGLKPGGAHGPLPVHPIAGAGQASGPECHVADHADQMADQPSGSQWRLATVGSDGDINAAAVAAYRASVQYGKPISERKLAEMFGKTSRRWARSRMTEARQSLAPA